MTREMMQRYALTEVERTFIERFPIAINTLVMTGSSRSYIQ
jgi:hypothetical protein